ncbi:TRAP transporter small permease [Achromobacter marplatensis]|uniref:TRAP transporter small permease n=1 Tax=Achromobacter marplatensis TaxID=470868 RepID=UPI0039F69259
MAFIDGCIAAACRVLEMAIALLLAAMVVLVFGNVVARYGFNSGITLSEELSRWMFIWLTFLGAVIALKERGHLGMDMVVAKLPTAGKKICLVVGQIIMLYIVGLMFKGSWEQAVINADVSAPVSGLPMAIVYVAGLVFSALAGLIIAVDLYRVLAGKLRDQDLIMVQESEEAVQLKQILDDANHGAPGRSA